MLRPCLGGYELIDDIKAEVEIHCRKTVCCADILAVAARDASVAAGSAHWDVPFGLKDGLIFLASEANSVPQGHENMTQLIDFFTDHLNLTVDDLVVLSGVHTIGRSSCDAVSDRIFNFSGTALPDPSMDIDYVNLLKKQCESNTKNLVNQDVTTPTSFDEAYYRNLGVLATDQLLSSDSRTASLVNVMASGVPKLFKGLFAVANANVRVGANQGQFRLKCSCVNPS